MRYLTENKILLEEPEDEQELEPIDIEAEESEDSNQEVENESSTSNEELPSEEHEETEVSKEDLDSGVSSMLNSSIVSTWNRIDEFTSILATIKSFGGDESLVTIIQSILDDEMIHVGQLQKALSLVSSSDDLISRGVEKAQDIIDSSKTAESDKEDIDNEEDVEDEEETQPESNTDEIEEVEEEEEASKEEKDESTNESLTKRCKIKYFEGEDLRVMQEMLRECNLKTKLLKGYFLVEGKVKDIYNASGMLDIPVHEEDLF